MVHINMVKGNFVFKEWDKESMKNMRDKCEELESLGYEMAEEEHGCLDVYFHFKKENCEEIVVTLMCC